MEAFSQFQLRIPRKRDSNALSILPPITQEEEEEGGGGVVNRAACATGQGMDFTFSLWKGNAIQSILVGNYFSQTS